MRWQQPLHLNDEVPNVETPSTSLDLVMGVLKNEYSAATINPNTDLNRLMDDSLAIVNIIMQLQDVIGRDADFARLAAVTQDFQNVTPLRLAEGFAEGFA